jgi:NAD/NADP transhydrogenase beta subunit
MQPESIRKFSLLILASLVLGGVGFVINYPVAIAKLQANPAMIKFGSGFLIGSFGIGLLIILLLWFFIVRRASNVARWIWVVFLALGLLGMPMVVVRAFHGEASWLPTVVSLINTAMQLAAAWFLFQPDSREWFASKGKGIDVSTFN